MKNDTYTIVKEYYKMIVVLFFSNSHFSNTCFINSDLLLTPNRFDIAVFEEFSFGLFSIGGIVIVKLYI